MSDQRRSDAPALDVEAFVHASAYASEALRRWSLNPDWLDGDQPADDPELPLDARLRRKRQLESLRILWGELRGRHDVERTGSLLSALARDCLGGALDAALARVGDLHGQLPGGPRLAVLALGKLGGDELNFNSDLDLVFAHGADGESDGRRRLPAREYLARVARELSTLMEQVTADGRAWVIDTRLRPYGQSGALVLSVDAMEQYFVSEGRAWERYAWLKAGLAAGDTAVGRQLIDRLGPFVFRRYLDYGLFDSLRDLHLEIDRKSRREDLADDVKRGPGGIRELEFLIQSLQLLRGGREPSLRTPGFLPALRAARDLRLLDPDEADSLGDCYRFLRALENRLQAVTGRQTHELPERPEARTALATLMGAEGWPALVERLDAVRRIVRTSFQARFERPEPAAPGASTGRGRGSSEAGSSSAPTMPWPPGDDLEQRLASLGFAVPDVAAAALSRLARRLERRPLSAEARRRLDRLMPRLLEKTLEPEDPDTGFEDLLELVETIARRSAYLSLLHERPRTLERTVRVFRLSGRVAHWVIGAPQLLDDLLDPINGFDLPEAPKVLPDDPESTLDALARYRQAGFVRTALGQLDDALDRRTARQQLTRLAESVLDAVARLTLAEPDRVAMIGYGNLGAGELHYSSDLDLVFLHPAGDPPLRGIQRLINALQLPLPGGKLYPVDTRLRPNGNAGLLVTAMDRFEAYQSDQAWTWEHQALIRARAVRGPDDLVDRFDRLRRDVLCRPRDHDRTRDEIVRMRRRQMAQRTETPVKRVLGHVQFIAEYGILTRAADEPGLIDARETGEQLRALGETGWLDGERIAQLRDLHAEACVLRDRSFLRRGVATATADDLVEAAERAWDAVFGQTVRGPGGAVH
ncbi:bifunctional [glutamate--ammonia ligase]-adenylyl-L-tyrosine phosphorylase/[glutamate--ammonia-ligase] adenylyltransferase [Halomonas denitrificans]|nr:bifunctional [glutamate--ammonia ligase]-adenylyl-L-tyrosine phosphorylase/[glutamate--ammonia-ligase] adenylyltransferase [Halomonas denitrificans]